MKYNMKKGTVYGVKVELQDTLEGEIYTDIFYFISDGDYTEEDIQDMIMDRYWRDSKLIEVIDEWEEASPVYIL